MVGIYALVDPRTGKIRYIGQSVCIETRFHQHCKSKYADSNYKKIRWVSELAALGLTPELRVLQTYDSLCSWKIDEDEKRLISQHRRRGDCDLNMATGGKHRGKSKFIMSTDRQWFEIAVNLRRFESQTWDTYKSLEMVCGTTKSEFFYRIVSASRSALAKAESLACKAMGNDMGSKWFTIGSPIPTEADWQEYCTESYGEIV